MGTAAPALLAWVPWLRYFFAARFSATLVPVIGSEP